MMTNSIIWENEKIILIELDRNKTSLYKLQSIRYSDTSYYHTLHNECRSLIDVIVLSQYRTCVHVHVLTHPGQCDRIKVPCFSTSFYGYLPPAVLFPVRTCFSIFDTQSTDGSIYKYIWKWK